MAERHPNQCAKCPWKKSTDPNDIPNGYCETKHRGLERTIADPNSISTDMGSAMACHESKVGHERMCTGWMHHQLGAGNNLALRISVIYGGTAPPGKTVGAQHECFEDTLPNG
jgi:hypothetical protein